VENNLDPQLKKERYPRTGDPTVEEDEDVAKDVNPIARFQNPSTIKMVTFTLN